MKKVFITAIIAVISITANAQTEKSTFLLGGGLSFTSTSFTGGGGSTSVFTLNPNVGYFFMKNYAIGGQLLLNSGGGNTAWSLGPLIRGYFTDNTKGKPFAQAGIGFGGASGGGNTSITFQLMGGYALFLNKSIAAEFTGNFQTVKGATIFGFGAGFQIHFAK
ncbi:MAG: outer membrane beta-barrel protein [Chitinophagaceae bacterium]|nr:outer membrane beta-barrel protein [Chitinophagaceae bacterium]MCW5904296.1 outer membrane beta-barrel protein [Chitinophagaceae bacterium]